MAACSAAIWGTSLVRVGGRADSGRSGEESSEGGRDVVREDLLGIFRSVDEGGGGRQNGCSWWGYASLEISLLDFENVI